MQGWTRRLLAVLLAALLAMAALAPGVLAEDWRAKLRDSYGLSDDYDEGIVDVPSDSGKAKSGKADSGKADAGKAESGKSDSGKRQWSSPITRPQEIVDYLDAYGELPDNFITKKEARALGWDSSYNYVGDVAPGMSIGGDRFGNYEGLLPEKKGRTWYECDANYKGKKRGAQRVLYSSDGLYYYTDDHYNTFTQMFPED